MGIRISRHTEIGVCTRRARRDGSRLTFCIFLQLGDEINCKYINIMDIERLIECVRRHVLLYDLSHNDYKNITLKAAIWESIGKELNQNSESVKSKWKSLRDGYTKYKKQIKATTGSRRKNIQYLWSSQLSFLDNFNAPLASASLVIEIPPSSPPLSLHTSNQDFNSQALGPTPSNPLTLPSTPPQSQVPPPELPANKTSTSNQLEPVQPLSSSSMQTEKRLLQDNSTIQSKRSKKTEIEDVDKVINFLNKKKKKEHDGTDHMFLSYADTFKKIPLREQALLKLEIAKLFTNTELRLLQNLDDTRLQYPSTTSPAYSNVESSVAPADNRKGVYKPSMWNSDHINFLSGNKYKGSISLSDSDPDQDVETVYVHLPCKRRASEAIDKDPQLETSAVTMEESAAAFGRSIGAQLHHLSKMQRCIAEKLISDVIYHGKMEQLSINSSINLNVEGNTVDTQPAESKDIVIPESAPSWCDTVHTNSNEQESCSSTLIIKEERMYKELDNEAEDPVDFIIKDELEDSQDALFLTQDDFDEQRNAVDIIKEELVDPTDYK